MELEDEVIYDIGSLNKCKVLYSMQWCKSSILCYIRRSDMNILGMIVLQATLAEGEFRYVSVLSESIAKYLSLCQSYPLYQDLGSLEKK